MDEITGETFSVRHHPAPATSILPDAPVDAALVTLDGTLRLNGLSGYAPITEMLQRALDQTGRIILDLRGLEFLNSSGIAMLSKFVIEARDRETATMTILGSRGVPWQGKSLINLSRLWPELILTILDPAPDS